MTTDCSLNTWKFQGQNMGITCCVQKLFLTFRTIIVHNMFCKKKSFWQRFACIRYQGIFLMTLCVRTVWWLSNDFLMTLWWLFVDTLITHRWLFSLDFLMTIQYLIICYCNEFIVPCWWLITSITFWLFELLQLFWRLIWTNEVLMTLIHYSYSFIGDSKMTQRWLKDDSLGSTLLFLKINSTTY